MMGQRCRRWTTITTTLGKRFLFPSNKLRLSSAALKLAHRLQRQSHIKTTLCRRLVVPPDCTLSEKATGDKCGNRPMHEIICQRSDKYFVEIL